jgi:hypothetical protein
MYVMQAGRDPEVQFNVILYLRTSGWKMSREGSIGIATLYGLHGPAITSRWEARFYAPVQTVPGGHPGSCTMGTGSLSEG